MSGFLRQSTAGQIRTIGPFIDDTDFKAVENGLTIANTDIKLKKNGATAVNKNSGGATSDVNGVYQVTWDATDTSTVGELHWSVLEAGALLAWGIYTVLEESIYDALFDSGAAGFDANGRVDVGSWLGVAAKNGATDNLPQTSPHGWQGVAIPSGNMIEDSTGARWTAKALEEAPSGGGGAGNIDVSPASFMNDQVKNESSEIPWMTKDDTGVPVAPTVNGSVYAVEDGTTTKITAGITTSYNHGGENGAHLTSIDTSNAAYNPEASYSVFAEGMTVDGIVDTGAALASFTLRTQSIDSIYGNGLIVALYSWDTNTAATDPGAGNVKANNSNYSLITEVYINGAAREGLNISALIEALKPGDLIVVAKDKDTTKYFDGIVSTAPTDNGGWYTIPITLKSFGDTIANNNVVDFGMFYIRAQLSPDELAQQRDALGIDGVKIAAVGGQLQVVAADVENIDGDAMRGTDDALLAVSAPANFEDMAITDTAGAVTVGTNNDKDGYSLAASITVKKGEALPQFQFQMVDTNDDPATGLTVTGQIAKDAGSLAAISNSIGEIGGGLYRINSGLTAAETNADAFILNFTAPGARTLAVEVLTQAE